MKNLLYFRHNAKHSQGPISFHYLNCHEITAVFDGSLVYRVNGEEYTVEKGDIIYVKYGSSREREPIRNTDYISLNFQSDEIYDFPVLFKNGISDIIRPLLKAMDTIRNYTAKIEDERFQLLTCCLIEQLKTQLRVEKEHPLVFKIKSYIKNHLADKITLSSISKHTFFSAIHCENVFKKETGTSIIDYVLNERIREAKALLTEGSLPLTKVSELVGFCDYNYFSRAFKKRVGISPKEYSKGSYT